LIVLALIAALALAVLPRLTSDVGGPLNVLLTVWVSVTLSVWVLVAIAAGWLADQKGRSPAIWFLIGLLSGPFAVLLRAALLGEHRVITGDAGSAASRSAVRRWCARYAGPRCRRK
jgi:MFS family permease